MPPPMSIIIMRMKIELSGREFIGTVEKPLVDRAETTLNKPCLRDERKLQPLWTVENMKSVTPMTTRKMKVLNSVE